MNKPTIAISAVQGAFIEHEQRLSRLGCEVFELRRKSDLARPFDALVLPGGESTTQAKLLHELGMFEILKQRIENGLPVLGTCAGLILLAEYITEDAGDLGGLDDKIASVRCAPEGFGTLPVIVRRNAYGRQLGSFFASEPFGSEEERAQGKAVVIPMVFIRAPSIVDVVSKAQTQPDILARAGGRIVAVRAQNQLGCAFHPELTQDDTVYEAFLELM